MEIKVTEKFLNLSGNAQKLLYLLFKSLSSRAKNKIIDKLKVHECFQELAIDSSNKARYMKELHEAGFIKMIDWSHKVLDRYNAIQSSYFIELQ